MVNRNDPNAARRTDNVNNNNSLSVSERSPSPLPSRRFHSKESVSDDIIRSLSNAYENKRARQVFEWERTRRSASVT